MVRRLDNVGPGDQAFNENRLERNGKCPVAPRRDLAFADAVFRMTMHSAPANAGFSRIGLLQGKYDR